MHRTDRIFLAASPRKCKRHSKLHPNEPRYYEYCLAFRCNQNCILFCPFLATDNVNDLAAKYLNAKRPTDDTLSAFACALLLPLLCRQTKQGGKKRWVKGPTKQINKSLRPSGEPEKQKKVLEPVAGRRRACGSPANLWLAAVLT